MATAMSLVDVGMYSCMHNNENSLLRRYFVDVSIMTSVGSQNNYD